MSLLSCLLAACTLPGQGPVSPSTIASSPPLTATVTGAQYHLVPEQSLVTVLVRRGGVLARLGHDHVVASHAVTGDVSLDRRLAHLSIPLDSLTVDEQALRQAAGLDPKVPDEDVQGTRRNMRVHVLQTTHYPQANVQVQCERDTFRHCHVEVELHGARHDYLMPLEVKVASNRLQASGFLILKQSDYGIVPFSVLGGALRVEDPVEIRFRVVAEQ